MTGVATGRALSAAAGAAEYRHVLAGAELDGPAERLAALLDPSFLSEAGWHPVSRVLSLPAGHRLLGRAVCRVGGGATTGHAGLGGGGFPLFSPPARRRPDPEPNPRAAPVPPPPAPPAPVRGA